MALQAAFAVVFLTSGPDTPPVVCGTIAGEFPQDWCWDYIAYDAELFALAQAIHATAGNVHVHVDNQAVVQIIVAGPSPAIFRSKHGHLWRWVFDESTPRTKVTKVKAHQRRPEKLHQVLGL
eukprot:1671082-Amphidinium_carterae.1